MNIETMTFVAFRRWFYIWAQQTSDDVRTCMYVVQVWICDNKNKYLCLYYTYLALIAQGLTFCLADEAYAAHCTLY